MLFDCKLHFEPSQAVWRRMEQQWREQAKYERELRIAKDVAETFPITERADLLLTLRDSLHSEEINELVTALRSDPQTDRIAKAKAQLKKLVEALNS